MHLGEIREEDSTELHPSPMAAQCSPSFLLPRPPLVTHLGLRALT